MKKSILILLVFTIIPFFGVQAQDDQENEKALKFLIGAAFEFGGDEVAEVIFTTGGDQKIYAGQGGSIHAGLQYQIPGVEKLLVRTTVGYKYVTTAADNANITLTRIPIHATANWLLTDDIRFGAGIAAHQSIKFKADGLGSDQDFESASGPMFELAYKWFGISYTIMDYVDEGGNTYNANSIGVTFYGAF